MRFLLIVAFALCLALTAWAHSVLPDQVAIHFAANGEPDGWATKTTSSAIFASLYVGLFVLFWFTPHLIRQVPSGWLNLPHKAYWLSPEHRDEAARRMQQLTDAFGAMTFAFFAIVGYLTVQAHQMEPVRLDESIFLIALVAYLLATMVWLIWLWMAYRIPAGASDVAPVEPE